MTTHEPRIPGNDTKAARRERKRNSPSWREKWYARKVAWLPYPYPITDAERRRHRYRVWVAVGGDA